MDVRRGARAVAIAAIILGVWIARPIGQTPDGGFTKAQADAGGATYKTACASCHRADLGGQDAAPQLAGDDFLAAWKARKASELIEFIAATMPPEGPTLSADQALSLVAFILQQNGGAPGTTALTATTAAPIGSVAPGKRPGPLVAAHGAVIR